MPDTKTTAITAIVGVVLTAAGVFIAFRDYQDKDRARPALDITSAVVIRRGGLEMKDYVIDTSKELDQLALTIRNQGSVEAVKITIPTTSTDEAGQVFRDAGKDLPMIRYSDMPPKTEQKVEVSDHGERGDNLIKVRFHGRLRYSNRNNGKTYEEPWCFSTSQFEVATHLLGEPADPEVSIPLSPCPL